MLLAMVLLQCTVYHACTGSSCELVSTYTQLVVDVKLFLRERLPPRITPNQSVTYEL